MGANKPWHCRMSCVMQSWGGENAWLGRPPVVNITRTVKHTKLGVYLQCFCLSVVSLSLQLAAPSDLDPGWRGEAVKLSTQRLQLFALHKNLRYLQIKLHHHVLRTQRCQCPQWFIFSSEREFLKVYNIRSYHHTISYSLIPPQSVGFYK